MTIHWYQDFRPQHATHSLWIWVFVCCLSQYVQSWIWRIHIPSGSDASKQTFNDSVAVSLGIFHLTNEQQHIHFCWLGCRWSMYSSTRLSVNDSCLSPAVRIWNEEITFADLASSHRVPPIAFRPFFLCNYCSARCSLPVIQVCTRHLGIHCVSFVWFLSIALSQKFCKKYDYSAL